MPDARYTRRAVPNRRADKPRKILPEISLGHFHCNLATSGSSELFFRGKNMGSVMPMAGDPFFYRLKTGANPHPQLLFHQS